MPNANNDKGKRGERAACVVLNTVLPGYGFGRKLGAGRMKDIGDLDNEVDPDLVVQVKTSIHTTQAIRNAADGAVAQQVNAHADIAVGVANIHRACGPVKFVAAAYDWPGGVEYLDPPVFGITSQAVAWLTGSDLPIDRRVAQVVRARDDTLYIGTLQVWAAGYLAVRAAIGIY